MAGWLHGVFVGEWLFVFPLCGFSLSLFCKCRDAPLQWPGHLALSGLGHTAGCAYWRSFVLIVDVPCLLCYLAVPGVWRFLRVTLLVTLCQWIGFQCIQLTAFEQRNTAVRTAAVLQTCNELSDSFMIDVSTMQMGSSWWLRRVGDAGAACCPSCTCDTVARRYLHDLDGRAVVSPFHSDNCHSSPW